MKSINFYKKSSFGIAALACISLLVSACGRKKDDQPIPNVRGNVIIEGNGIRSASAFSNQQTLDIRVLNIYRNGISYNSTQSNYGISSVMIDMNVNNQQVPTVNLSPKNQTSNNQFGQPINNNTMYRGATGGLNNCMMQNMGMNINTAFMGNNLIQLCNYGITNIEYTCEMSNNCDTVYITIWAQPNMYAQNTFYNQNSNIISNQFNFNEMKQIGIMKIMSQNRITSAIEQQGDASRLMTHEQMVNELQRLAN